MDLQQTSTSSPGSDADGERESGARQGAAVECAANETSNANESPGAKEDGASDSGIVPEAPTDSCPARDSQQEDAGEPASPISPSVRRLAKQYDLDITGIRGTGPSGRVRVSDVMGVLGTRAAAPDEQRAESAPPAVRAAAAPASSAITRAPAEPRPAPVTIVFECDMSAVLAHKKQREQSGAEVALTSYYVAACVRALRAAPEIRSAACSLNLAVTRPGADGGSDALLLHDVGAWSLDGFNAALLDPAARDERPAQSAPPLEPLVVLHHHGLAGSLLVTPTPLARGQVASVGIGAVRKQIVVREGAGESGARVAPRCYLTLTFDPEWIDLHDGTRLLRELVRTLEQWTADDQVENDVQ